MKLKAITEYKDEVRIMASARSYLVFPILSAHSLFSVVVG